MQTLKTTYKLLLIALAALLINFHIASAATPNPMTMLKSVSDEVLLGLKKERPKTKTSDEWIYRLVNRIVLPHADLTRISRAVIGRNVWLKSSPSERNAFTKAFTRTVIKTYASALDAYTDETIRFFPIRGGYEGRKMLLVRSRVIRSDGPPVQLDYRLILTQNQWKIYDLIVEGVSLIQSFQSQFASEFSQGKTIKQVTQELQKKR